MRKGAALLLAAATMLLVGFTWEGNGSENLPCSEGAHWVLAPSNDVTSASVTVDGTTYVMTQNGEGSWSADSGPVATDSVVTYDYTGEQSPEPHLQLSHCIGGESESPTPTPTESPSPTESPTPPPSTSPPPPPRGRWTPTWTPTWSPSHHLLRGNKELAFTGSSYVVPLAALAGLLFLGGLALLRYSRKRA